MKINCVSCGHQIAVDDDSYARYHGPLRCWVCHVVMVVHIADGCVDSVSLPGMTWDSPAAPNNGAAQVPSPKTKRAAAEVNHD